MPSLDILFILHAFRKREENSVLLSLTLFAIYYLHIHYFSIFLRLTGDLGQFSFQCDYVCGMVKRKRYKIVTMVHNAT